VASGCSLVLHQQTMRRSGFRPGGGELGDGAGGAGGRASRCRAAADDDGARCAGRHRCRRGGGRRPAVRGHRDPDPGPRVAAARASVGSPRTWPLVWVDAPSFAGVERMPGPADAASLQLARAGASVRGCGRTTMSRPCSRAAIARSAGHAERLVVLAAIAVFSGWHWRELERPQVAVAELALLAVLATVPGLAGAIGRRRWAFASIPVVIGGAVWATFGISRGSSTIASTAASRDRSSGRRTQLVRRGHAVRRRSGSRSPSRWSSSPSSP